MGNLLLLAASNTNQTLTLGQGGKFSDFRYIYLELSLSGSYGTVLNSQFLPVYAMTNPVKQSCTSRVYLYYDSTRNGSVLYISDTKVQTICNGVQIYVYGIY